PAIGEVNGRPRTPRLGRVVNGESAVGARVELPGIVSRGDARNGLHEKVTPKRGVVADPAPIATASVGEDGLAPGQIAGPSRFAGTIDAGEELVGFPVAESRLRRARQH